jgi:hypothetical protein
MSEANKFQVDGSHYKTAYEHWDYALDAGLGVLEYAATKHLERYDKKGEALIDLQKARHYVQKLTENVTVVALLCPRDRFPLSYLREVAKRFIDANNISGAAADAVMYLTCWQTRKALVRSSAAIDTLIASMDVSNRAEPYERWLSSGAPVPLEDSNKHATRFDDNNEEEEAG